ncbi:ATP synthase subunit K, partial [Colletotrichum shisoi]
MSGIYDSSFRTNFELRVSTPSTNLIQLQLPPPHRTNSPPKARKPPNPATMVQMYTIAGRQVGSHYLAMGVLATIFGGAYVGTSGSKPKATAAPPINASSSDEADFI